MGWKEIAGILTRSLHDRITAAALQQLTSDGVTRKTPPSWSSTVLPSFCDVLGIPFWDVVAGLDDDQRKLLRALDAIRRKRPRRAHGFVAETTIRAQDITGVDAPEGDEEAWSARLPRGH